jgi:hypothetical protein
MRRTLKPIGVALAAAWMALEALPGSAAEPVRSVDIVESSAFLEGYRAASEAQSAEFYELYSDRAVIHARIPDHDQGIAFQGRAFKAWGRQLLAEGRAGPDGSVFRDATVEQRGNRLLIRAKRYSTTRCYWDSGYRMGIEREGSTYRIVDERLTMSPTTHCPEGRTTADVSRGMAAPSREVSLAPSPASVRLLDSPSTLGWHPLSQEELRDRAMQLAQQMLATHAAPSSPNSAIPRSWAGAAPQAVMAREGDPPVASRGRADASSDLRITPRNR